MLSSNHKLPSLNLASILTTWFALYEDFNSANNLLYALKRENIECYLANPQNTALEIE